MTPTQSTSLPVVLVPGYWLGGWAWDAVAERLSAAGHDVTAVTLPGLADVSADRHGVRFADHVDAVRAALEAGGEEGVLVAHSGAGAVASAVLDAVPDRVARVVYVDSGPTAAGAVPRPDVSADAVELPLPSFEELEAAGASLAGLDQEALDRFRDRAVPHPAGAVRGPVLLENPRRHAVPATLVCSSMAGETVQALTASGHPMFAAVAELVAVEYIDLPTGHWPMWSRPADLADVIAAAATRGR
ncbi:alpha/beta fold hydrolase [Georgenia thermotolerans]|uniref:Alpha/beta fold hydrolase n=1 Tax=Georgenia thermotolerans TaxID=527326 RepID=A0A7J5UUS9_9MICO|nr:alpha/beta hydrolase [Georgenia thermotolerans]KAE8766032.1 alpha/beta fold hydrolase [Georgenia thermotolerans]